MRTLTALMSILLLTGTSPGAVESLVERPVAVRGGVLMTPVRLRGGRSWPKRVELKLEDGRRISGVIAWIGTRTTSDARRWTEDPRRVEVRATPPGDETVEVAAPYLLAELPAAGEGVMRLGRQRLRPIWHDPPMSPIVSGTLARETRPDRPDASSPFEHWRWEMVGDRLGMAAPDPGELGPLAGLVARHYADLWRVGLSRLAEHDPTVAELCREALTAVCHDGDVAFAGWVSDPGDTATLLTPLLEPDVSPTRLVEQAAAWVDAREPLLMWLETDHGPSVRLVVVNRTTRPQVARFRWMQSDEVPIAAEIPPRGLERVAIERPPPPERPPGRLPGWEPPPRPLVLEIVTDGRRYQLPVAVGAIPAVPPGAFLPPLRGPLTLAEVETRQRVPMRPDEVAVAHVRRRHGRWELFVECRRPVSAKDPGAASPAAAGPLPLGEEAVTVVIGPGSREGGPDVLLVVPESGGHRLQRGRPSPDLEIHRRSWADRWYCRIVLPDAWLDASMIDPTILLGCARTRAGRPDFQVTPARSVPWRPVVGRAAVELGEW